MFDWNIFMPQFILEGYVKLPNENKAYISSYKNINISYEVEQRVYTDKNGNSVVKSTEHPVIRYNVNMTIENKKILADLFSKNNTYNNFVTSREAELVFLNSCMVIRHYKCRVDSIPAYLTQEIILRNPADKIIIIKINIDDYRIIDDAVKQNEIGRFDLLDID